MHTAFLRAQTSSGEVAIDVPKMSQERQQEHEGMAEPMWWTEHHGVVFVAHPWGRGQEI